MKRRKSYPAIITAIILLFNAVYPILSVSAATEDIDMIMVLGKTRAYYSGAVAGLGSAAPYKLNDTIMIPVRAVAEAVGASVEYDSENAQTIVSKDGHTVCLTVGSDTITADGANISAGAAVTLTNGCMMSPALAFVEGMGMKSFWNSDGVIVIGQRMLNPNKESGFISTTVAEITGDKYWQYTHEADYVPLEEVQKQLTFTTVTKEMVKQAIESTGRLDKHPSLLITEEDLARMQQYLADGDPFFKAVYDNTLSYCNNAVNEPMPEYKLDAANLRLEDLHNFPTNPLPALALMYRLSGDKRFLEHARGVLAAVSTFEDWGAPRHFLDAGVATTYVALAYDLLYDELTKPERAAVENVIMENTLKPGLKGMESGDFWTYSAANWNTICHTGIRLGAYVCYESNPDWCAEIIAMTFNRETEYIRAFEPMGQSEEGQGYFDYGTSFMEIGFEADYNMLGTDFGLSDTNGLRNAGWFPLRSGGTMAGISLGDGEALSKVALPRLWFARRYDDVELGKIIFDKLSSEKSYEWRMLVFYDRDFYDRAMNADDAVMPQLDSHIPALDLISFRDSWSQNGSYISIHAGKNNASHGHMDAGQVDIQADGVYWVMGSLGKDNYVYPGYFDATRPGYEDAISEQASAGREHFYRIRAEGKTAVVVKETGKADIRTDQNPVGVPIIEKIVSKPKGGFCTVDLTDAYSRDVRSYRRGIMMSNERRVMTIQDEIETKSTTSTIWWLMNTPADISVSEDGRSALLSMGEKHMWVGLDAQDGAVFREIPASYLPGESFPLTRNTPNTTKKLAVELKNTQKASITVNFVPLNVGEKEPGVKIPTTKPLDKWSIDSGSLVVTERPKLTDLRVDGETIDGFASDSYTYTVHSKLAMDSAEEPVIEADSEDVITYAKDEGKTVITVTDRDNAQNVSKYLVSVRKMGAPQSSDKLEIVSAAASDTPESNHTADLMIDGDWQTADSRWSAEGEQYAVFDLGSIKNINILGVAFLRDYERVASFDVQTSPDRENWQTVFSGTSGGETDNVEYFTLEPSVGRYVRVNFHGCDISSWNSVLEVMVYGK